MNSNTNDSALHKRFQFFLQAMQAEDLDGILLLTYPRLFDIVPQKIMREKLIAAFDNDEFHINMDDFTLLGYEESLVFARGQYVPIRYRMLMSLQLNEEKTDPKEQEEYIQFMERMFHAAYGKEHAWYEPTTKSLCVYQHKMVLAVQNEHSPLWTFIGLSPIEGLNTIIPQEVLDQLAEKDEHDD